MSHEVTGANTFLEYIKQCAHKDLFVYFTATKKEDGQPWCPDCAAADPVVFASLKSLSKELKFVAVRIDRPYWKESPDNELKKEHGIKCLPTLVQWGCVESLGEDECKDESKVLSYFESHS